MAEKEYNAVHKAMCFRGRVLGEFTHWVSTVIKSPDVEVPVAPGQTTVKTLCPCCVFWRGVLVGGLTGLSASAVIHLLI